MCTNKCDYNIRNKMKMQVTVNIKIVREKDVL